MQFLPKGKNVVLALVSTKKVDMEELAVLEGQGPEGGRCAGEGLGCGEGSGDGGVGDQFPVSL